MNNYEQLLQEAADKGVTVNEHYSFNSNRIQGLYCDGNIAINSSLDTSIERGCVLAEELSHHDITAGNIIDITDIASAKEEHKARILSYNRLIGLTGLVGAFEAKCSSRYEVAEHLNVTEHFLEEALMYYTSKYGAYVILDNYVITFIPALAVMKLI